MEITHNNKTYRWIGNAWWDKSLHSCEMRVESDGLVYFVGIGWNAFYETHHIVEQLVKLGYLEEVKENKDHSIIEKLREEFKNLHKSFVITDFAYNKLWQFIKTLEQPKEEPEETDEAPCWHNRISTEWICSECWEKIPWHWAVEGYSKKDLTPTPWQMIEVKTNDWRWVKTQFIAMDWDAYHVKNVEWCDYFMFARPLPQEDIELPDFDYLKITQWENYKFATLAKQVELLTNAVNKLLKK